MQVYKEDSIFYNKVDRVARLMDELGLTIECVCGEIRFYDNKNDNVQLICKDSKETLSEFPHCFEYQLKVFNS